MPIKRTPRGVRKDGWIAPLVLWTCIGAATLGTLYAVQSLRVDRGATVDVAEASPPFESGSPTPTPVEVPAELARLPVKGRAPMTAYSREAFGEPWADVDGNGCDTRNDILKRDLEAYESDDGCTVISGLLIDPYSGRRIDFERGIDTSFEVQIDHVVALGNAWATGAQRLSDEERLEMANDPINLFAVDGSLNLQKSDGDAATWLPPRSDFRCDYVSRQIEVKARYGLWVTQPEKDAMLRVLADC